jgi:hypothetical protein
MKNNYGIKMNCSNDKIIKNVLNGKLKASQSCNLQLGKVASENFDYTKFIEDYSHDMCTILAFWLHDTHNLKIGAIRAIDQNDEDDIDYETVVHQYVYLSDDLILDARGIDTEKAMLDYYRDTSLFDDEDWDFIVDEDYQHDASKKSCRDYDEHKDSFNHFLNLLGENLR